MRSRRFTTAITSYFIASAMLIGCGDSGSSVRQEHYPPSNPSVQSSSSPEGEISGQNPPVGQSSSSVETAARDSTPVCLVPTAPGIQEVRNDVAVIDYSNAADGYITADYTGTCEKVKFRITGPDAIDYTYDLHGNASANPGFETFPLSSGNGSYKVTVFENVGGTSYTTCLFTQFDVEIADEFGPFLYPNQYVNFTADSKVVAKGAELTAFSESELDIVADIYDYITSSITYDYAKASDPPTGYTTDVDEILESGTGICLDYAAVMASMLRSQSIPTRLEIGYAQDAYHAWISVYISDVGWLNGIIEFDGNTWTLVDPTFGANTDDKTLKKFIGDGTNYTLQKMY